MDLRLLCTAPLLALLATGAWAAGEDGSDTVGGTPPAAMEVDPEKDLPMPAEGFGQVDETLGNPHDPTVLGDTEEGEPNPSVAGARESSEELSPEEVAARADEQRGPLPPFEQVDADGDGKLDENEVAEVEPLKEQFQAADVDQDGAIDEAEFSAFETRIGVMPGQDSPALEQGPAEEVPGDTTAAE